MQGIISFYGLDKKKEHLNDVTAYGEIFNPHALTCASWDHPHNTVLRITSEDGRSIDVRVNDKGPNKKLNRILDLTPAAFKKLAPLNQGLITGTVHVIDDVSESLKLK